MHVQQQHTIELIYFTDHKTTKILQGKFKGKNTEITSETHLDNKTPKNIIQYLLGEEVRVVLHKVQSLIEGRNYLFR